MSQISDFVKLMDLLAESIERARQKIPSRQKYEWCCGDDRVVGFNQRFFQNFGRLKRNPDIG